jgi:superfamily II DNA or RNA helicase
MQILTEKLREYLKQQAPFSIVDRGIELASSGSVLECSKSGNRVLGSVQDQSGSQYSVYLDIISSNDVEAGCDCCSTEDMREQWCQHAVALLWRAGELDFFTPSSGFAEQQSTYRMNTSTPAEIADLLNEVSQTAVVINKVSDYQPKVNIKLNLASDRLGVQVIFDDEIQTPALFYGIDNRSVRSLDNILLQILDSEGTWDENLNTWFISSSKGIEIALGLLNEYTEVVTLTTGKKVTYAKELLNAKVTIEWHETSAELILYWITPNKKQHIKEHDLIGTGPYWTFLEGSLYKLSPSAAKISSIFPYSSTITISKAQMGPILEILNEGLVNPNLVEVINPNKQPESLQKEPTPILEVEKRNIPRDSANPLESIELTARLEFEYPSPPEGQDVVILPHRALEQQYTEQITAMGFSWNANRRCYVITGDSALDLIHSANSTFNKEWIIKGLDQIKKEIRFADLQLSVSVSGKNEEKPTKTGPIDWFDCHITLSQNSANVPLSMLFKNLLPNTNRWILLDSGAYAKVPGGGVTQLKNTLGMIDPNFKLSNAIKTKLSVAQAISISRIEDSQFNLMLDKNIKNIARKLQDFENIGKINPTKSFLGKLRPYQHEGLCWLHFLHEYDLHGILADEMGLGKTVQTIALLQHLFDAQRKKNKLTKPALIIAPTSVITNWQYELKRFAPNLKVLLLHGIGRKSFFHKISSYDVVITSYALLRLDRYELEKHGYSYLILDEAQNIKNFQAATTKAAKALKADHRLALSGTPTENRPLELWSIMDFLMPGYLGSSDFFKNQIEKPILEQGPGVQQASYLNSKTKPFILRRLKSQVEKDLPPKTESVLHTTMSDSQRELYMQILDEVRPRVFEAIEEKGIRGASVSILAALLRLRQVCNHPNSIDALKELSGYESGKFEALKELVTEALESKRKILLFSQFREMMNIIKNWMESEKINFLTLDGTTRNRQQLVDQFNGDPNIQLFLISLKAGGTGLNLTAADTVIIYDPWWNPAVESQAVDRAHRIGQTKAVNVYRLVTEGSIEQKIMDLKSKKASLVDALINENGLSSLKLTKADLESFFSPPPLS